MGELLFDGNSLSETARMLGARLAATRAELLREEIAAAGSFGAHHQMTQDVNASLGEQDIELALIAEIMGNLSAQDRTPHGKSPFGAGTFSSGHGGSSYGDGGTPSALEPRERTVRPREKLVMVNRTKRR